jgi:hypothetical protein
LASKFVDWTDTYKQDKARGMLPIASTPPKRIELESKPKGKDSRKGKPSATVSAARQNNRRQSDTGTDNTRYTRTTNKEAHMPAVKTSKTSKSAPTRRRAAKAETVESTLTLVMAKAPSGKGGFLYNDAQDHDEKLHVTSMYLSQNAIAEMFGGEAPDSITVSA